jgi:hypothetical protein
MFISLSIGSPVSGQRDHTLPDIRPTPSPPLSVLSFLASNPGAFGQIVIVVPKLTVVPFRFSRSVLYLSHRLG